MKTEKENIYTIPNFLSAYRIAAFPFILFIALNGNEKLFAAFLIVNLVTDILDGFIARRFNMQTQLGAKLDSLADLGTYILAFTGIILFHRGYFVEHIIGFSVFGILYIATLLMTLIKFGRLCGLHLYSFKITGYLQGFFFAWLFTFPVPEWYFYLMITAGCAANVEEAIIFTMLKQPRSNVKGLYWILKEKQFKSL